MNYLCLVLALVGSPVFAAQLSLSLPLGRTTYQCNEWIPVTVLGLRGNNTPSEELVLRLRGEDSSSLTFNLPRRPASPGAAARSVEHLRVNGWLLRPGNYTVEAASGAVMAATMISDRATSILRCSSSARAPTIGPSPTGICRPGSGAQRSLFTPRHWIGR